jgi:uncharacterized protein with von Willebrand factor type A (vWA) domain
MSVLARSKFEVADHLLLRGIFLALRDEGVELSVKDLEDALEALRLGYGLNRRDRLQWLCTTLWARGADDLRKIDLLFQYLPEPSEDQLEAVGLKQKKQPGPTQVEVLASEAGLSAAPLMAFDSGSQEGARLPRANAPSGLGRRYNLTASSAIPLRSLVIIWRRFRQSARLGPSSLVDIDATIAQQCRRGGLVELEMVPQRQNRARLVILLDGSPSMAPWRSFEGVLRESLRSSQLGHSVIYYFHNVPGEFLFREHTLTDPVPFEECRRRHEAFALLVVSDAGAARGSRRRRRVLETRSFVEQTWGFWHPIVWLNPMPIARWDGNTAGQIRRIQGVSMFELSENGMVQAVDVLRGLKG